MPEQENAWTYKEYLPENSEIIVDYTKPPKERVGFNYPILRTYNQSILHGAYTTLLKKWLNLNFWRFIPALLIFLSLFTIGLWVTFFIEHPSSLSNISNVISDQKPNQTLWSQVNGCSTPDPKCYFITTYQNKSSMILTYSNYNTSSIEYTINSRFIYSLPLAGLIIYWMFGIPLVSAFILSRNKEKLAELVPRWNFNDSKNKKSLKYEWIEPDKIFENKYIIPYFNNIYLDWKATSDFSKYLQKVEILAIPLPSHPYVDPKKEAIRQKNIERQKKRYSDGKPKTEYEFRAVFYFSQKPQNGHLKVIFD